MDSATVMTSPGCKKNGVVSPCLAMRLASTLIGRAPCRRLIVTFEALAARVYPPAMPIACNKLSVSPFGKYYDPGLLMAPRMVNRCLAKSLRTTVILGFFR